MIKAAAAFEYSKDWLVTDSHRLSFLSTTPATLFIHPKDKEINKSFHRAIAVELYVIVWYDKSLSGAIVPKTNLGKL